MAGLAKAFGTGAMTISIDDIEDAKVILVTGSNTTKTHPIIGYHIIRAVTERGARLIVIDPRRIKLVEFADVWLNPRPGTDVAILNAMMNVILEEDLVDESFIKQRTEGFEELKAILPEFTPEEVEKITGVSAYDIRVAARLYASEGRASIFYTMGITQHVCGTDNVLALANLAMMTGNVGRRGAGVNPLRGQNNVQGACDMGALPNVLTGYRSVENKEAREVFEKHWGVILPSNPGLTVTEISNKALEGEIKALYIMGENPAVSDPDTQHIRKALESLDFLVVQDIFLTETAQLADVVLPGASFAEKDGTFTNTERRVQKVRKATEPPGKAKADWEIICELGLALRYPMKYNSPEDIMSEIRQLTPTYAGITYRRLDLQGGLQWPCPTEDHPGTRMLHTENFFRGKGLFTPTRYKPPAEEFDDDYPLILTTGRSTWQFHTRTMTGKSEGLNALAPSNYIEMNPIDALIYGLADGDEVVVESRRGRIVTKVVITDDIRPRVVFMPFHYAESAANMLTSTAIDPVAKIPELKVCAIRVEKVKKDVDLELEESLEL